ncbi:MAG: adenine phosphoribosyltransferase [candidate division Zixibacteria bacterium]|nr:adenine phosphoribosyltransferase [candidate division Zixibacteria bacterium]
MSHDALKKKIRDIPDYPQEGIIFRDITTLLRDKGAFREVLSILVDRYRDRAIDAVAAVEARGFIFGGALAGSLNVGFIPIRKPGKLPSETIAETYALEYGTDSVEMHRDALKANQKILLVDDVIATGGTLAAASRLIRKAEGEVFGIAAVVELLYLNGRQQLSDYDVFSIVRYDGE